MYQRRAYGLDENRPAAVAKRHGRGHRTARENLTQLVDEGSFIEYGRLMVAAQRRRRDFQDLLENTAGDGMVAGIGSVNGDLFGQDDAQAVVMSYDYMVLAGTQGGQNHRKKDRLFELAIHNKLPVVLYAEGGGGRPGDTDGIGGSGLDCLAFALFAELSGLVPLIGITNGRCFAGNAVLLGCCDVIIATEGSNIGVGGPAMVEGGGLGIFKPEEIGPVEVQAPNGVIDILVKDEEEATDVAKQYLSYFQGPVDQWEAPDQRVLRHLVPENRKRVYDMRDIIENLCDVDSVLELRPHWGPGAITVLARIEGRPIGIVANNPHHLAGAVDATAGDKGARFMQLCDAHDIPLLFLCDTPGIMVGPQAEYEATVRHAARMFVTAASVDVPMMTIVTRKGYGLGAQAMAGGSFKATSFTVAWPTGEFGGMGLEGFVKLGYRKELEAIEDPAERLAAYEERVARLYDNGKAVNTGSYFEIDDVIDPAESRDWILMALRAAPKPAPRTGKKRPMVDTW
jgi:acetyl-CoA carboxylase carboxyltransferase component